MKPPLTWLRSDRRRLALVVVLVVVVSARALLPVLLEATLEAGELAGPLPARLTVTERRGQQVTVQTRNRLALMRWLSASPGWRLVGPAELRSELAERLGRLIP